MIYQFPRESGGAQAINSISAGFKGIPFILGVDQ
jgi:hypothetical protein